MLGLGLGIGIGIGIAGAFLDAFEKESTSGLAFARSHGVNYQTFASWIQKPRLERGSYPVSAVPGNLLAITLAEVELPDGPSPSLVAPLERSASPVEIALDGGLVIRATLLPACPCATTTA